MSCFDGHMQEYSRVSLDRFDGKNLQSTVYFLSHLHADHTVGLNGYLFLNRLKSNKDIFLYCSAVTKVLIEASPNYHQISPYVKCLDVNTPTTVTIPDPLYEETEQITVTLLPAFHCPGSVMFLIEGNEGTVLYTGDFRWEHLDLEQMHHLRSADSTKKIKSLYVDTTFCCPENLHIPSRRQCIDAVFQIVREWTSQSPQHVVYILLKAYYGHEPLINSVASRLKQKVHVCRHKYDVYERIHELSGNFTFDGTSTQLHACDRKCTVNIDGQTLPCRDVHDAEKVLCILPTTMYFTHFQQLSLEKIVKRVKSNLYRACYSFHSSYTEVKDLLAYLKPDQAFANVKCPKDDTLSQTQHQLNVMLKECKEIGAGEATPDEIEVRELGTLKIKPGYKTRKRKGRESPSDSESLDFGSPPKRSFSESSDIEPVTLAGNQRGRGRGKRTLESVSQTVVSTRRSAHLPASSSVLENEVTPKKRKTSPTRSEISDLYVTPEKSKKDDNEIDQQSSFLGSQRSDSELSLFSSQKSHDASLPSYVETDWTGGSFLAAVSSSEDSEGMFYVTEDNQELDEEDEDCDVDDPIVSIDQGVIENGTKDIPERTERGILHVGDNTDIKKDVLQNVPEIDEDIPSKSNIIDDPDDKKEQSTENDNNLDEMVDVNKDINADKEGLDVNDDLHLHFSGSTVTESIDKDIIDEEFKSANQNKSDCSPVEESHLDTKHVSSKSDVNETTSDRNDEIVILDSDSSEQMTLEDYAEFINNINTDDETKTAMETAVDNADHRDIEQEPISDVQEINSIIIEDNTSSDGESTHDENVQVKKQSKTNELERDGSHPDSANGNVYKQNNESNEVVDEHGDDGEVVGNTGKDINTEVNVDEKTVNKHLVADNENCNKTYDVVEIVDLTGEDLVEKYETQETSKMGKKAIKISLLSKNVCNKSKKTDEKSKIENAKTVATDSEMIEETISKSDGENKQVDEDTVVTEELLHVEGDASEDECEYISSSPEWLSSSKASTKRNETPENKTSCENAPDNDSEMQAESLETVVVNEKELEKRAEVKRQAMGFVCETDSESDSDSDSSPDSPTAEVLYDDYIELSSGTDDDDDDDDPSGAGSRTGRNNGSNQMSSDNSRSEPGNNESNSSSSGWLHSHKGRGHSDEAGVEEMESVSVRSELRESSLSSEKAKSVDDRRSNEIIGKNIKSISVSAFKKREYRRSMNNYRCNQTPETTKSLQSSYPVPPSVHSYQQTSYPSYFVGSQSYPYQYPPYYNYGTNDPMQSASQPNVPNVSEAASVSQPSMIPGMSETESHDSRSSHFRTVSLSGKRKQHSPVKEKKNLSSMEQDGAKLFQRGSTGSCNEHANSTKSHPSSWTSGTRKSRDYSKTEGQLQANLGLVSAAVTNQYVMKAPEKVDIASIKANISALTGISVVNAQSAASSGNVGNESGESLDEMVEKLKKIEQMKALLNVVSGNTRDTNNVSNAEAGNKEVFDYAHRNSRKMDEVEEDYHRRSNYPDTFREHLDGEHMREPYIHDREFPRRSSSREDEDYELWLRERRHERYPRRPPSPSWRYHEDVYHERPPPLHRRCLDLDRLVPFPHRDPVYGRSSHHREYEYDRSASRHRDHDPDYRRHPPPYHRDTEYDRPPRHRDQEYERPSPPPWHRDQEYERPPPWHRDTEYDRPPPWHRDVDYEGPPPRFRDLEYKRPAPLLHVHQPHRIHSTHDEHNKYPYTKIKKSDDGQGSRNQNNYHSDYQNAAGGGSVKTTSYLKLQAQLTEFKKKPIMAHVLSRSGQVLSVGQANTSLQHLQTTKTSDDVNVDDNSKTDTDTPVFQTGIIPASSSQVGGTWLIVM